MPDTKDELIDDLLAENQRLRVEVEEKKTKNEAQLKELENIHYVYQNQRQNVKALNHRNAQLSKNLHEFQQHYNLLFSDHARLKNELQQQVAMTEQWIETGKNFNLKCDRLKKELDRTKLELPNGCECVKLKLEIAEMKECQVCNETFDHGKHQPAKANCGHVLYCKSCLTKIAITTGKCPSCRKPFKIRDIVAVNLSFI